MKPMDSRLLENGLSAPIPAIGYQLGKVLAERAGKGGLLQTRDHEVDLDFLAREGFCEVEPLPEVHAQIFETWTKRGVVTSTLDAGAYSVRWQGLTFEAVIASWREGWDKHNAFFVTGEDRDALRRFIAAALEATHVPRNAVLVFQRSCFSPDKVLYAATESASWEEIVLTGDLASRLRAEVRSFLEAKPLYEKYGVPYKRGILLTGPPGNGKTQCVRLLVKEAALPTIYVKSFAARYGEEEANVANVFARARKIAPCMLVLEDIDSLVRPHCLSVFLNELDGLRADTGILTVATTNHPERLDPALLERPSRFDRKYHFDLPHSEERRSYLDIWGKRFEPAMQIDAASAALLVERTEGMSFAFLKEVVVSAMTRWILEPTPGTMGSLALAELEGLRATWRAIDEGDLPEPLPEKPDDD